MNDARANPKLKPCLCRPRGGIYCDAKISSCSKCGWNKHVEKERIDKLREKAKEKASAN